MLSVNYCKRYFSNKKNSYSDKEIEEIRVILYQMAEVSIENYLSKKSNIDKHKIKEKPPNPCLN